MKNIKLNKKYSLNLRQVFTFRTLILGFILGTSSLKGVYWVFESIIVQENILFALGFAIVFVGGFVYWIYNDFLLKNDTYAKDVSGEEKYANYSLEEILIEINTNKEKSLRYQFYFKIMQVVSAGYKESINVGYASENERALLRECFEDLYDESYKMQNIPKLHNIESAKKYIQESTDMMLYGFWIIAKKYDKQDQYEYQKLIENLSIGAKEKRKMKKVSKKVMKYVKKNDLVDIYQMYSHDEDTHIRLMYMMFYLLLFKYYAKDKFDVFYTLWFIIAPLNIIRGILDI